MKLFKSKTDKRRDQFANLIGEFANANPKFKDSLMVFCDPETNTVVGAYRGLVSGFQNKSQSKRLKDLFRYDEKDDDRNGNMSNRNQAVGQFLMELDGMVDAFAKQLAGIKSGEKDLRALEKSGMLNIGTSKVDEKGNSREVAVVR